jgi:hypothetical protein
MWPVRSASGGTIELRAHGGYFRRVAAWQEENAWSASRGQVGRGGGCCSLAVGDSALGTE